MLRFTLVCLSLLCLGHGSFAQDSDPIRDDYRPKVAEFGMETLMDYHTATSSESQNTAQNEVDWDRLYKAKIAIPLIIRSERMAGLQLKYYQHRFFFDEESYVDDFGYYSHLNNSRFTSLGVRGFLQDTYKDGSRLKVIAGAETKSDRLKWTRNSAKYFFSGIYTWRRDRRTELGVGFVTNYDVRIFNVYPVFIYKKQFQRGYFLDLYLPKAIKLRKRINQSNFLIASTQVRGWRYNMTNALEGENRDLTLRKADLQFNIAYEREIHDWLWLGIEAGYNHNIRYYLSEPGMRRNDAIVNIRSGDAKYCKVSIFLVPPRKLMNL